MTLIKKVAYFQVCERCHSHGCIVFPDGTKGMPCFSKEQAFEELLVALATGEVTEEEEMHLREEIKQCSSLEDNLPEGLLDNLLDGIIEEELASRDMFEGDESLDDDVVIH